MERRRTELEKVIMNLPDEWNKEGLLKEDTGRLNEYGNIEYDIMSGDKVAGYTVEIEADSGRTRHKGFGNGCFWTEWE